MYKVTGYTVPACILQLSILCRERTSSICTPTGWGSTRCGRCWCRRRRRRPSARSCRPPWSGTASTDQSSNSTGEMEGALLGCAAACRESFRVFTFITCFMTQPAGRCTYCQSKARYSWNIFQKISPYKPKRNPVEVSSQDIQGT